MRKDVTRVSTTYRIYLHTVWGAGQPNWGSSGPRHPGVRGQSWGFRRPSSCPCQASSACYHKVGGHEAWGHQTGCQATRQRGRVHLSDFSQLFGLSGNKQDIYLQWKCTANKHVYSDYCAKWQHLPEYFLLVPLQSASYESIVVVMSALFALLLICDAFG